MTQFKRPDYDPSLFAPGPARDARFKVVEQWLDCENLPEDDPAREVEFFNRQMNEEVNGMECAARALSDFPDAEWILRMSIARQCYDEARHVEMFRHMLESRGGTVGQSPVMNFQYRIITHVDSLVGRLAVQNRTFEAGGIDAIEVGIQDVSDKGDMAQAALYDAQLADEITHVRFANEYVTRAMTTNPALVMSLGRVLQYSSKAFGQVMGEGPVNAVDYPVAETARLEAGFSDEEIRRAVQFSVRKSSGG